MSGDMDFKAAVSPSECDPVVEQAQLMEPTSPFNENASHLDRDIPVEPAQPANAGELSEQPEPLEHTKPAQPGEPVGDLELTKSLNPRDAPTRLWRATYLSVIGASHLKSGVPCQDSSIAEVSDDQKWAYAIVADGHGSAAYFRSDRGARIAAETLRNMFQNVIDTALDSGDGPTDIAAKTWEGSAPQRVVGQWRASIYADLLNDPPQVSGSSKLEPGVIRRLDELRSREGYSRVYELSQQFQNFAQFAGQHSVTNGPNYLPLPSDPGWDRESLGDWQARAYGTTLLGILIGPHVLYWFQIGDGAIMQVKWGDVTYVVAPPADAIANETPSLCLDDAVHQVSAGIRVLEADEWLDALILSTDGLPNSYSEPAGYRRFCADITTAAKSPDIGERLTRWLPEISARGSGDDVSIAAIWAQPAKPARYVPAHALKDEENTSC